MKIICLACFLFVAVVFGRKIENEIQSLDYEPDIEPYETLAPTERPIFKYQKNGIKVDLKIVPSPNDTTHEDEFPNFPAKEIGVCVLDLSLTCAQRRFHHFLDKIRRLKEITLFGNWIKLVRAKEPAQDFADRRSLNSGGGMTDVISEDIDSFFDVFALRINLPSVQGKKKKNQIDVMFDETGLEEGRGKKGGGGGGGKGGGKCKKMMMMMLMMVKMKMMGMMGMTAMKGMMMAGMSLMISKWMLIQKLMDAKKGGGGGGGGGGGPWQGGGGGGGGGGPLKEIILVTKAAGGGGGGGGGSGCCGGGGGGAPMDSYGAPPPSSSYGGPAGGGWDSGGGGGGGGGGWGRSFDAYGSPSNLISRIIPRPSGDQEDYKSRIGDDVISNKDASHLETRRIGVGASGYETISPVYKVGVYNASSNSSDAQKSSKKLTNGGDDSSPSPQSQFVTLRSSYQIHPSKETRGISASDTVDNPVYVNDWKNFELAKQWTASQQSSMPDQAADRSVFAQNHKPYERLIKDRNVVFHGV